MSTHNLYVMAHFWKLV